MKNLLLLGLSFILLIGCTPTIEYRYKYVYVDKPVPVAVTAPKDFIDPYLPINSLTDKDKKDYPKISKAYVSSIKILKKEVKLRDVALDAYRPKKENK